jgi:hypothetical protein
VKRTYDDELVSISVAKTDVLGFPIGRGSGIVKEWCIKENERDRIGLAVLNGKRTKQLERRKEKMLRMKFNDRAEQK